MKNSKKKNKYEISQQWYSNSIEDHLIYRIKQKREAILFGWQLKNSKESINFEINQTIDWSSYSILFNRIIFWEYHINVWFYGNDISIPYEERRRRENNRQETHDCWWKRFISSSSPLTTNILCFFFHMVIWIFDCDCR